MTIWELALGVGVGYFCARVALATLSLLGVTAAHLLGRWGSGPIGRALDDYRDALGG